MRLPAASIFLHRHIRTSFCLLREIARILAEVQADETLAEGATKRRYESFPTNDCSVSSMVHLSHSSDNRLGPSSAASMGYVAIGITGLVDGDRRWRHARRENKHLAEMSSRCAPHTRRLLDDPRGMHRPPITVPLKLTNPVR
jgi:hypothetical protein